MSEGGGTMVSDQDIAEALQSLFRESYSNPNTSNNLTSLNAVVQQLQSKLGALDLSHKVDFIRGQIQLLFRPPQPQPQPQPPPHLSPHLIHQTPQDHFALHHTPNFQLSHPSQLPPNYVLHRPEGFGFRPSPPSQHLIRTEGNPTAVSTSVATASASIAAAEAPKESAQTGRKRRGGPGGLNKLCSVSPALQVIVGQPALPRTEIVKQLWAYIRKNNLQDPSNKRKIICNDELREVFETDCTDMFKMNKLLSKHISPLEPTKQTGQQSKKVKADVESESLNAESVPIVIISEALANFFSTGEREMSQAEVLRRVWEYIKVNQLEDPLNSMTIHCDAKLRELFECESISALGIPEMLARQHLFKRS